MLQPYYHTLIRTHTHTHAEIGLRVQEIKAKSAALDSKRLMIKFEELHTEQRHPALAHECSEITSC